MCLAKVDWLTRDSAEGQAWREYLLVDALKDSSRRQVSTTGSHDAAACAAGAGTAHADAADAIPAEVRQQRAGGRVTGRITALGGRTDRRHGAVRDIETYERSGLPSDARRLALDFQHLTVSPIEGRRHLADRVDLHYRNANCRIAVTEELLNKLIPARNLEYAPVEDTVLGRPVRGESLMATEVAVRMLPNPQRVRLALEVTGEHFIADDDRGRAGPLPQRQPVVLRGAEAVGNRHERHQRVAGGGRRGKRDATPRRGHALGRRPADWCPGPGRGQVAIGAELAGGCAGSEAEGGRESPPAHRHGNPATA